MTRQELIQSISQWMQVEEDTLRYRVLSEALRQLKPISVEDMKTIIYSHLVIPDYKGDNGYGIDWRKIENAHKEIFDRD